MGKSARVVFKTVLGSLLGVFAAFIVLHGIATMQIRKRLAEGVRRNCSTCALEIGTIRISLLDFSVKLHDVRFGWGNVQATRIDARAGSILADLSPRFARQVEISKVHVDSPVVTVTEGDLVSPSSPNEAGESPWTFSVRELRIEDGRFTYVRVRSTGKAALRVSGIEGRIGAFGSAQGLRETETVGRAEGKLERSGKFELEVKASPFAKAKSLAVDLKMIGQKLSDLNPFLEADDGIQLSGILRQGRSWVRIEGKRLTGSTMARYEGLDIQFGKTEERGALKALISNLVEELKVNESKPEILPGERKGSLVELEREKGEPIVKFILRGMRESALKVATGPSG